ncbi:MAG: GIY-YIG nuclease family protein [Candidatus Hadarchaeales archaeon]
MKGTYALFIQVPFDVEIVIGALGRKSFRAGYYVYVGSAMGGLKERVRRHLEKKKRMHWHVDYLLTRARVVDFIFAEGRGECEVARNLSSRLQPIEGFGSSDCECQTHLFYHPEISVLMSVTADAFKACGLKPHGREALGV